MLAVLGTLIFCGGIAFFFVMLHFHRRPGVAHWLETRAVGEITVFVSMMVVLYGIAMLGRFGLQFRTQTFGLSEVLEIGAIIGATAVIVWKAYLPPPAEPAPVTDRGAGPGTSAPTSRKAA